MIVHRQRETVLAEQRWQVEAAVLKLLSRRCTCLEFHPTRDNIVLAGDKKGMIAVWDFDKVGVQKEGHTEGRSAQGLLHLLRCIARAIFVMPQGMPHDNNRIQRVDHTACSSAML